MFVKTRETLLFVRAYRVVLLRFRYDANSRTTLGVSWCLNNFTISRQNRRHIPSVIFGKGFFERDIGVRETERVSRGKRFLRSRLNVICRSREYESTRKSTILFENRTIRFNCVFNAIIDTHTHTHVYISVVLLASRKLFYRLGQRRIFRGFN